MFYWIVKHVTLGPFLRIAFRPRVEGLANIPEHGGAILASNHLSFCDSVFLHLIAPRHVSFLAKAEYFTGRGVKGTLTRWFLSGIGQLPIDRTDSSAARAALDTGKRVLADGQLLGIYPEGTRSPDGRLYRGKTGMARMALEAGVPVIPCAMVGTDRIQPIGRTLPHLVRPTIRIGRPLDFARYEGMAGDRFIERSMTDEVMYELMKLSGQQYVDLYATKVKAANATKAGAANATKVNADKTAKAPGVSSGPGLPAPRRDAA